MENLWLLRQMRQPGRSINSDLTSSTFSNFLKIFLNKRNFKLKKRGLCQRLCGEHQDFNE